MNATLENNLKWNVWLQEPDQLGVIAKHLETEIRQDKNAISHQRSSIVSRIMHFAHRRALAIAVANVMVNWYG